MILAISGARERTIQAEAKMRLIILIILIILIVGALPAWPYSIGWGCYPAGGPGTILILLLILAVLGYLYRLPARPNNTAGRPEGDRRNFYAESGEWPLKR
jgi:Protein of unknown function (DUF3309)